LTKKQEKNTTFPEGAALEKRGGRVSQPEGSARSLLRVQKRGANLSAKGNWNQGRREEVTSRQTSTIKKEISIFFGEGGSSLGCPRNQSKKRKKGGCEGILGVEKKKGNHASSEKKKTGEVRRSWEKKKHANL